ncbi:hypothetical protein RJI07_00640 [Mycoplasmatota bacterium WC30]
MSVEKIKSILNDLLVEKHKKLFLILRYKKKSVLYDTKGNLTLFMIDENNYKFKYFQKENVDIFVYLNTYSTLNHNVKLTREIDNANNWSKQYSANDIKGYEIIDNSQVIERKTNNFGKMVAGGLLFGGIGVLAGAIDKGGKIKRKTKSDIRIRLILNDLHNASVELKCDSFEIAYNFLYTLRILEEKYSNSLLKDNLSKIDKIENLNVKNTDFPQNIKSSSFSEQISKLKDLLIDGIISVEEFNLLKSRITVKSDI